MSQKFNWNNFWYVYEVVAGMEPLHKKDFEEEVEKAKEKLLKLFGGTKIEIESSPQLTIDEKREIISIYAANIENRARKKKIPDSSIIKIEKEMLLFLQMWVNEKDLITGYVTKNSPILTLSGGEIKPGTKISKALRFYLSQKGLEQYTDFIIQDLSILQGQLKALNTTSKVVISLEPIDFLLASNVTTGWKTCHSIVSGTHAAGNLSYLFDTHTVIAYAYRTEKPVWGLKFPRKLWRQWVHIDVENAIALFQRQYPSQILSFEKAARSIVGDALKKYHGTEKSWRKRD
ncbi:MAG TPA: hypothetical protein GXX15_10680 [Clostridia bacterium]|nr:hypothetical protein [Clostridia bacterium]